MGIKIDVKHRIVVNGREYASSQEMPDELRRAYQAAMAKNAGLAATRPGGRIRINGREYESLDAMPPEDRKLYELSMAAAGDDATRVTVLPAPTPKSAAPKLAPGEQPRSSGSATKWLVVIGVAVLLYLLAQAVGVPGINR